MTHSFPTRRAYDRPHFLDSSVAEIIVAYSSEFRGFANYYAIADGVKGSLDNLELIVIRSMLETVACRRRVGRASVQKSLLLGSAYGVSTLVRGQPRVHKLWRLDRRGVVEGKSGSVRENPG